MFSFIPYGTAVKDCMVKSSHNTVVGDVQILGSASINNLLAVLNKGVRFIEFDIFESHEDSTKAVVSHGNQKYNVQVVSAVDLELCLQMVAQYAWKDTNEPLFIYLELNINRENHALCSSITDAFKRNLGNRLHVDPWVNFKDMDVCLLANRCVVIPSVTIAELFPIMQTTMYGSGNFINRSSSEPVVSDSEKCIRVYADNVFVSHNPDPEPFLKAKTQFLCFNWMYEDNNLKTLSQFFIRGVMQRK